MKIVHQGIIIVLVPLVIELVIVGSLIASMQASNDAINEQQKFTRLTRLMTATNGKMQEAFFQAGFLAIDKDPKYESGLREKVMIVEKGVEQIKAAFLEDSRLARYKPTIDKDWEDVRATLLELGAPKPDLFHRSKDEKVMMMLVVQEKTASIRMILEEALRDFYDLSDEAYKRTQETKVAMWSILVVGVLLNVVVALGLLRYFFKSIVTRIGQISENSLYLVRGEPLLPVLQGPEDELVQLDKVFHVVAETLREAGARERAVFENAVDVICSLDGDGRLMRINRAFNELTGFEIEEAVENHIMEYVVKEQHEKTHDFLQNAKRDPDSNYNLEVGMLTKYGGVRDVLLSIKWDTAEKSYFVVIHDITGRKELERAKQEFVNMVSHDLRSPLTSLRVSLGLFLNGVFGEQTAKAKIRLGTMDESIDRLIRLINDLLDVEKFEAGQMQLELEQTSTNHLIASAFEAVSGMAEAQKVELNVVSNDRQLLVDGDRIIQVLVNLLSNAIKFSPQQSEVEVRAFERDGMAEFRVIDHGRGIPADKLESVFERFKQVDAKNAVEKKGTGLGLAICKNIIEAHGGTIGVDSVEGEGSQFWFRVKMPA
ncbi:MAG: PAS domain-containing sensor histidine kinase [Candidatus Melainabacteria bacterium]|nr:PAS domain-containing sensor histidine kinase [Candidatus Melainabacteria bacterium]